MNHSLYKYTHIRISGGALLIIFYIICLFVVPPLPSRSFLGNVSNVRLTDFMLIFLVVYHIYSTRSVTLPRSISSGLVTYLLVYFVGFLSVIFINNTGLYLSLIYFGKFFQYIIIFFVFYNCFQNNSTRRMALVAILLTLFVNALWVLIRSLEVGRPTMIGTSSIFVTGYILAFGVLLPLPLIYYRQSYDKLIIFYVLCVLVCFAALVANGSRAILVGTIIGIAIITAVYNWYAATAIIGTTTVVFITIISFDLSIERIKSLALLLSNPSEVRSFRIRLERWERGLQIWQENPLFGRGLSRVSNTTVVENQYLIFLSEMGVLGFILLIISGMYIFRSLLCRVVSDQKNIRAFALSGVGILSMLLVAGMFSASLWAIRSMEVFSVLLAIILSEQK